MTNKPETKIASDHWPFPAPRLSGLLQSGFEDLPKHMVFNTIRPCNDKEHNAPGLLYVPEGKRYRHVCPKCGNTQFLYPRGVSL